MSSDVVNICLDVYKKKMKNYTIDNLAIFVNKISSRFIEVLFELIINLMHKSIFEKLVEVLHYILFRLKFRFCNEIEDKIKTIFKNFSISALKKFALEPQPGFFTKFIDHLFNNYCGCSELTGIFTDLLIILKKASPCDLKLYYKSKSSNNDDDYNNNDDCYKDQELIFDSDENNNGADVEDLCEMIMP